MIYIQEGSMWTYGLMSIVNDERSLALAVRIPCLLGCYNNKEHNKYFFFTGIFYIYKERI